MKDKERALALIEKMPDDATLEDIKYELDMLAEMRARLADENAPTVSAEEAKRHLKRWLE